MTSMKAAEAREKLCRLLDEAATLYLLAIPGMRESIRDGLNTPVSECQSEPGW